MRLNRTLTTVQHGLCVYVNWQFKQRAAPGPLPQRIRMRFASLALAVALGCATQAAAQSQSSTGHRVWPAVGNWQVMLGTLPDGRLICTAHHKAVQMNGYGYTLGFSFSGQESRLALIHMGPDAPSAAEISLQADGRFVADFAALANGGQGIMPGNALHPINAIMPGDSYTRVVIPALSHAREMTVTAGNQHYSFRLAGFSQTTAQLVQCARLANQP